MVDSFTLFAGWLIDGTGEPIKKNVLLGVENGLIVSLKENQIYDPTIHNIENLSRLTVLPGLIDSHVHIFMSGTSHQEVRRQQLDASFKTMRKIIFRHLNQQLVHGVVALRDGGDYAGHALRYKKEILPSQDLPICLRSAGKAWRAQGRYGKLIGRPPGKKTSLAQAIAREKDGIDHVKIVNSGLNSLTIFGKETPPQFSPAQLKAAVRTGGDLGLKTMVHANGKLSVRLAIEAGCHSIEHGFFMGRDNLRKMADKQILWVPTVYTMKAYLESLTTGRREKEISRKNLDHQINQISQSMKYGVSIAVGTDCGSLGVHHGSALKEELALLMQAGMPVEMVVQCATLNGAKALGLEDRFGRLKTGMPATLVVVSGDPSKLPETLGSPQKIFIQGKEWKAVAKSAQNQYA